MPVSLILAADSEGELAGMLAHSIAHIVEGHGTRMAARRQVGNSNFLLVFAGGWIGMGAAGNTRPSVPMAYLKLWRSYELDADRQAVNMMAAAGYEPGALLAYIRRTQRAGSNVFSALPGREERIAALEAAIARLPQRGGIVR